MSVNILTQLSERQIVLSAAIRKVLFLARGDRLVACRSGDTILLKPLEVPKEDGCKRWLEEARAWASESGLAEDDIPGIIADVRAKRR